MAPRAAIGVPLRDEVSHLGPALCSILAQIDGAVVVVDDSDSDDPGALVAGLAREPVRYERNSGRLGLVGAWRRCFDLARDVAPEAEYFAWGSDHDLWEPDWLAALAAELDAHPEAVLAYPLNDRIDHSGLVVAAPWRFDTVGIRNPWRRFAATVRRMRAGDMVYGLVRVDALARCGVLRDVLLPDRLLLAELALLGEFRQVPRVLWHRRHVPREGSESRRQLKEHGTRPPWARLPWELQHAGALAWSGRPASAFTYLVLSPSCRATRLLRRSLRGHRASAARRA